MTSPEVSIRDVELLNLQALTDQCEGVDKENWFRREVFTSLRKGLLKVGLHFTFGKYTCT
jgi:hypothetical protein